MKYTFFFLAIVLSSCSPRLVSNFVNHSYPMVNPFESFGVVDNDTTRLDDNNFIGLIKVKDNLLSSDCDYWTIMELLKEEARKSGGNLIRIDEHKKPTTYGSNCHQIKASIFRVDNPRPYKTTIYWHPKRKLVIEDFKGTIESRPFQAVTSSGIEYYIKPIPLKRGFYITVRAQFDCYKSYFKPSVSDSSVLAHEQLHFDITEIYARRFFKALLETKLDRKDFRNQANKLLDDIATELFVKQDEYDSEVYENRELQSEWNSWVQSELEKLSEYKQKEIKNYGG